MSWPFSHVVLSSNEDPLYIHFWPYVSWAWSKMFPGVAVHLAFVTDRNEDDPYVAALRGYGDVELYRPVPGIPEANQAKVARYALACEFEDEVCYLEDIDLLPLDRDWFVGKTRTRPAGHILFVGHDVYGEGVNGKIPASMITAEGKTLRQLFNPAGLPFSEWVAQLDNIKCRVYHEAVTHSTDMDVLGYPMFSDETLIRDLRKQNPVPSHHVTRDYSVESDTLDRSCWKVDCQKLARGGYIHSHLCRPLSLHFNLLSPLLDSLQARYELTPPPGALDFTRPLSLDADCPYYELDEEFMSFVLNRVPQNSVVVEFGSGRETTKYLSRHYDVISVDHDIEFVNLYAAEYVWSPVVDGRYEIHNDDPDKLERRLLYKMSRVYSKRGYGLVMLNNWHAPDLRKSSIEFLHLFDLGRGVPLVAVKSDDNGLEVAKACSAAVGRPATKIGSFFVI